MKKLINRPEDVVKEELAGMEALHPELIRVDYENQVIVRKDAPVRGKVGVISGGGSGHEPMHGGFVGHGMLDAACPGAVFTSPVPDQMLAATRAVNGGAGVLHVVKNYTGDVLNFEMAAELAQAEGIEVASVVTNDDVAVQNSLYTAGRRGVGVTVLLEKIVGGLAEMGAPLEQVAALERKIRVGESKLCAYQLRRLRHLRDITHAKLAQRLLHLWIIGINGTDLKSVRLLDQQKVL